MKKIIALLLALLLALGGLSALAEDEAQPAQVITCTEVTLNRDLLQLYGKELDKQRTDNLYSQLFSLLADVAEHADFYYYVDNTMADMWLEVNDKYLTDLTAFYADDDTMMVVSDLFPHYALKTAGGVNRGKTISAQDAAKYLEEAGEAYKADLIQYYLSLGDKVRVSEDGTAQGVLLDTHMLADVIELIAKRAREDQMIETVLQLYIDRMNRQIDEMVELYASLDIAVPEGQLKHITVADLWEQIDERVAEMREEEAEEVADLRLYQEENGVAAELETDTMLLSVDVGEVSGAEDILITLLQRSSTLTDWENVAKSLTDGTNKRDSMLQMEIKIGQNEVSMDGGLAVNGGNYNVSMYSQAQNVGQADYAGYLAFTIDPDMGDDLLMSETYIQLAKQKAELPSIEGLTVIDADNMTEEQMNALMQDVIGYGFPMLAANAVYAMPDQVAVIMQMLAASNDLLSGYAVAGQDDTTWDVSPAADIDLSGAWKAADGSASMSLNADGTCLLTFGTASYSATWEASYGILTLTQSGSEIYGYYDSDTGVLTLDLVTVQVALTRE